MIPPVIVGIVGPDLCIGCGLCAGICPAGVLAMTWNQYGEYNPVAVSPCLTGCGLCLKVCPFADTGADEGTIGGRLFRDIPDSRFTPEIGWFIATMAGYAGEYREYGSSGGMATWLLEELLALGVVDYIVCVAPTGDPERLFTYTIFDTPEGVRTGAGSVYYPVELSVVVSRILATPGRYAVTGLPCFIKAIHRAKLQNKRLAERLVVCIGLVCGQYKSRHYTDYFAAVAGLEGEVAGVRYREKRSDRPASDFQYRFWNIEGREARISASEGIAPAWTNRWFTPNACNYCDDIFAECADVTFMDAWLPTYSRDHRGTNLVVVRSPVIADLLDTGRREGRLWAEPVPVVDLIKSQAGVVELKRRHLAHRLHRDRAQGIRVPEKRVGPKRSLDPLLRQEIRLKEEMRVRSRERWILHRTDPAQFRNEMQDLTNRMKKVETLSRILHFPRRTIRRVAQKVGGSRHG